MDARWFPCLFHLVRVLKEFKLAAHTHSQFLCVFNNKLHTNVWNNRISHSIVYIIYIDTTSSQRVTQRMSEQESWTKHDLPLKQCSSSSSSSSSVRLHNLRDYCVSFFLYQPSIFSLNVFFSFLVCYTALNCVYESSFLPVHCIPIRSRTHTHTYLNTDNLL